MVNNDLKIVLPNYNEVEVKMPAMCRTIYILFLKHPEGIALRDIAGHRAGHRAREVVVEADNGNTLEDV